MSFSEGPIETSEALLRAIDVYCFGKQWMYHIGAAKGVVISQFLQRCIQDRRASNALHPFTILDVGTYCGYSAIVLAKTMLQQYAASSSETTQFKVLSLETNTKFAQVAQTLIQMAKLEKYIQVILYHPNMSSNALTRVLQQHVPHEYGHQIDFCLLDHDKDKYLSDLRQLEANNWIQSGTYVAADNVVVAHHQLQSYRTYMNQKQQNGQVQTSMIEQQLEYSDQNDPSLRDGIELTVYL